MSLSLTSPIGVFDSGIGGLTVLQALQARLPGESFLYLGDTARLPYGTKSRDTVIRYALKATEPLVARGAKLLVIACNTASTHALEILQTHYKTIDVIGVIEPGAEAACHTSQTGNIGVIATESTVKAGAYEKAIKKNHPDLTITSIAATLLVGLAEEGWTEGPIPLAVIRRYIEPLLKKTTIDCLILGCTHFPLLRAAIGEVVGPDIKIIDSGVVTAEVVAKRLINKHLSAPVSHTPQIKLLATDGPDRFARVAGQFLKRVVRAEDIELVEL